MLGVCKLIKVAKYTLVPLTMVAALLLSPGSTRSSPERLSVVYCIDCVPFHFQDDSGQPVGLIIDLWRLWSEKTGIEIDFSAATWDETLRVVGDGEADAHAGLFFNKERDKFLDYGAALTRTDTQAFFHKSLPHIKRLADIEAYRVGVLSEDFVEGYLQEKVPTADVVGYQSYQELLAKVKAGGLRAFAADTLTALFYLKQNDMSEDYPVSNSLLLYQNDWFTASGEGNAETLKIINDGMALISDRERNEINAKWGPAELQSSDLKQLTPREQAWIENNRSLQLGVDPAWPPFDYVDENGLHLGLSADILRLLQQRLGLSFELVPDLSWAQVLKGVKNGEIDLLSVCAPTPEREEFLRFTRPIITIPWVIATKKGFRDVTDLSDLQGSSVAITKGYAVYDLARAKHPDMPIIEVTSPLEGLRAVAFGEVDAYVDNLGVINQLSQENGLTNVQIAADSGLPQQSLSICVRSDLPELVEILNKGLADLHPDELRTILRKWVPVELRSAIKPEKTTIPAAAWWVVALVLGSFFGLIVTFRVLLKTVSDENLAAQFGSQRFRLLITTALGFFVFAVLSAGWLSMVHNKKKSLELVHTNLSVVLNATSQRLSDWVGYRRLSLSDFALQPELATLTEALLQLSASRADIFQSDAFENTQTFFEKNQRRFGNLGFYIIDHAKRNIAADRQQDIGATNVIARHRPDLIDRALEGETVFVPPMDTDIALSEDEYGPLTAAIFFVTPIKSSDGRILGALAQRADPSKNFTRVLRVGRSGESGESYAFDHQGTLLSESRFDDDLHKIGLLAPDERSMLNIQIRDPGANMLEGERTDIVREVLPFTRMAKSAISGEADIDISGYPDYRGVPVFGAWKWDRELGIGLATEIDVEEGLAAYHRIRLTVYVFLSVILFVSICAILFALGLGERAIRAVRRARDELELRVKERTVEVQAQQDLTQAVLESMTVGVVAFDKELKLIAWNPQFAKIRGYPEDMLSTETRFQDLVHFDVERHEFGDGDPEDIFQHTIQVARKFKRHSFERRRPNGRYIEVNGGPIPGGGFVSTFTDITQRKRSEAELANQKAIVDMTLENMDQGILMVDADLTIRAYNSNAEKLFGIAPGMIAQAGTFPNLLQAWFRDTLNVPDWKAYLKRTIDSAEASDRSTYEINFDDGRIIDVRHISISEGGFVRTFTDVSEAKKKEVELSKAFAVISDSINYASNIQRALLTGEKMLDAIMRDHFSLWAPRDIVGGDLYWCHTWDDGVLLIVADCTGHGVPGAFMTMLTTGAIDRAMGEVPPGKVGDLIQRIHQIVQTTLGQHGRSGLSDDGLELGVCFIDPDMTELLFAGARFSLFIVEDQDVEEVKGTKSGVGYRGIPLTQTFDQVSLTLTSKQSFYISSDGYIDQVGGKRRRMLGKRLFKTLLLEIQTLPFDEQKKRLEAALADYQGDEPRRDDVTVIGFKP